MKTKNQIEPSLPEFAATSAANEEGFSPTRDTTSGSRKQQAWSPKEVWRTRVKAPELARGEVAPS
jgi:hypothetical protein